MNPPKQPVQTDCKPTETPAQELVRRAVAQDRMMRSPVERRPATSAEILSPSRAVRASALARGGHTT